MDPVSNANRIAQILRQRLLERARGRPSAAATGAQAGRADPLRELARAEGTPDRLLKRALVQSILDEQFNADVVGEARFQQVIERVTDALAADPEAQRLLTRRVEDLKAEARRQAGAGVSGGPRPGRRRREQDSRDRYSGDKAGHSAPFGDIGRRGRAPVHPPRPDRP